MKVGDVVRMRSGGPSMTVVHIEEGKVMVMYFDNNNVMHDAVLPDTALVHWSISLFDRT